MGWMSLGERGEGLGWEGDTSAREQGKKILPRGKPRGSIFLYLRSHLSDRMGGEEYLSTREIGKWITVGGRRRAR